ncbi:MAG TPA: hypothetical protein VJO35_09790 [Terriglobales bacterium]|nr:hypothetical protein [Terriglobales bacterium]
MSRKPRDMGHPAGEAKVLDLSTFQLAGDIPASAQWSTVRVGYKGRTADLVPVALSYDEGGRYGVQTPFGEGTSPLFKGSMWHVDTTYNTIITTGNGGSEPTAAEVTLFYNGGKDTYRVEKMLAPGQQLWLNVGELIRNQVPDSDGHTIPPGTMAGSYELRDLDHGLVGQLYEGKLVIDKTYGHAAYGCGRCCGYDELQLTPSPFSGPPNIDNDDVIQANASCTGQVVDVTSGGYSWASSKPAVATLPTRTLHTVAVGTATGSAFIQLTSPGPQHQGQCPKITWQPAQAVNVASLTCSPSTVTRSGSVTCTAVGPSGSTFSNWKFSDGTNTVNGSGTNSTWSGAIVTSGTVSVTITSSGQRAYPSASITVNGRSNFAFTAVNPTQQAGNSITCYDGSTTTLVSPPNSTSVEGASCANQAFGFTTTQVSDNGPNNGYQYVSTVSNSDGTSPTQFPFIVVTDLLSTSTFYNAQCGTYASTNTSGLIAGSQLNQDVFDHEQGSVLSHWTEYRDAQNDNGNNVGTAMDNTVGAPGTGTSAYNDAVSNAAKAAISRILTAGENEPCGGSPNKDSSQSCAFCGNINYSPYQSCGNATPTPHCQ